MSALLNDLNDGLTEPVGPLSADSTARVLTAAGLPVTSVAEATAATVSFGSAVPVATPAVPAAVG